MWVILRNGRSLHFREAKHWGIENGTLKVIGARKRLIASIPVDAAAAWYYDCEDVTTYTATDELEVCE